MSSNIDVEYVVDTIVRAARDMGRDQREALAKEYDEDADRCRFRLEYELGDYLPIRKRIEGIINTGCTYSADVTLREVHDMIEGELIDSLNLEQVKELAALIREEIYADQRIDTLRSDRATYQVLAECIRKM